MKGQLGLHPRLLSRLIRRKIWKELQLKSVTRLAGFQEWARGRVVSCDVDITICPVLKTMVLIQSLIWKGMAPSREGC